MTESVSSRLAALEQQMEDMRARHRRQWNFPEDQLETFIHALAACLPEVRNLEEGQERCATCGHPMATHDSGPSGDGCRFKFGWGHECECGWPVSDKKTSRVDGSHDVPAAGSTAQFAISGAPTQAIMDVYNKTGEKICESRSPDGDGQRDSSIGDRPAESLAESTAKAEPGSGSASKHVKTTEGGVKHVAAALVQEGDGPAIVGSTPTDSQTLDTLRSTVRRLELERDEAMKLRPATESVGDLNSVGPLARAPRVPSREEQLEAQVATLTAEQDARLDTDTSAKLRHIADVLLPKAEADVLRLRQDVEFQRARADKWVAVTEKRDAELEQLHTRLAALKDALSRHLSEADDPCADRGAEWPCDVARAVAALDAPPESK